MERPYFKNKLKKFSFKNGFTLIELLVVIAIVALLSSVVLSSLKSARQKSEYSKANIELREFVKVATIAQGESAKTLVTITGTGCSECSCWNKGSIKNIGENTDCYQVWISSLSKIQEATKGLVSGIENMKRDPWGSPYLLDENEGEWSGDFCRMDGVHSAGPDGIPYTLDDIVFSIPFITKGCTR